MALVLNMAYMAKDSVNVFDIMTAVDFVVGSDVVTMAIGRLLTDKNEAIHRIDLDRIRRGSPLVDCD